MRRNKVKIRDGKGQSFKMLIWTPSSATNLKFWNCDRTRYQAGDWEAIDKGFIRHTDGDAFLADRKSPILPGYCFSGAGFGVFNDLFLGQSGAVEGHDYQPFEW